MLFVRTMCSHGDIPGVLLSRMRLRADWCRIFEKRRNFCCSTKSGCVVGNISSDSTEWKRDGGPGGAARDGLWTLKRTDGCRGTGWRRTRRDSLRRIVTQVFGKQLRVVAENFRRKRKRRENRGLAGPNFHFSCRRTNAGSGLVEPVEEALAEGRGAEVLGDAFD